MLDIALKVYNKTLGSQIIPIKQEDMSKTIEVILSNSLNKNVKVMNNGLDKDMEIRIYKSLEE